MKKTTAPCCLALLASMWSLVGHAEEGIKWGGDMPLVEVPTKNWDAPLRFLSGKAPSAPASHAPRGTREHVTVKFAIQVDGTVGQIIVVETSNPLVNDWVIEAVRGWRFTPATKGGVAQIIWAQQAFTLGF